MKKAFSPIPYSDRKGNAKTQWMQLGVCFESAESGSITLLLDALPAPIWDPERSKNVYKIVCLEEKADHE